MKPNHRWKTRLCGVLLAGSMVLGLLPTSALSFAGGEEPVTLSWSPQKQTEDGVGCVVLSASLHTGPDKAPTGALIDISLTEVEAQALLPNWQGTSLPEEELAASGEGEASDTGDPENTDTSGDAGASVASHTAGDSGPQAILITKGDGAVLRIRLTATAPTYADTLTFTVQDADDLTIDVTSADILVQIYEADDLIPDITGIPLLTDGDSAAIATAPLHILRILPEEITIQAPSETVVLDGDGNKDLVYTITVQNTAQTAGKDYPLTITWPEALSRPEGALSLSSSDGSNLYTIACGETTLATLALPEGVEGSGLKASANGLTLTITLPSSGDEAGNPSYVMTFTGKGEALIRPQDGLDGEITLATTNSQDETVSASIPVTVGEAPLPGGDAGYRVEDVNTSGELSQVVGWADGNNEAGLRPTWGWDTRAGDLVPHLYFTINGVIRELTPQNMAIVGLTAETWPKISTTASGFTVSGLPTQIREVSDYDQKPPVDVAWSLAPPDTSPAGYAFVNVSEENKDQYTSVSALGWYYMLESQFTFTVEVRKGSDKTLEREQVADILSNFQFKWSYTGGDGSEGIMDMVQDPDLDTDFAFVGTDSEGHVLNQVTITGLWKYNVDGSPISYQVTGVESDDKLHQEELKDSAAALLGEPEEDWLQVLYDNSGVANHTSDTDAVYSGGKLQLILSGETTFSAKKSWLDQAPDEGLAGRPNVTFTLWRYQENQSYKTAAQVTGVEMELNSGAGTTPIPGQSAAGMDYSYYPVAFTDAEGVPRTFPKYTADGYAYIYGAKEEMSSGSYEQLYEVVNDETGEVTLADTLPYEGSRDAGDKLLYQDGTLSNRLIGSVQVPVTKKWDAAAYQSEFSDVAVELTLQSKLKIEGDEAWKEVEGDGEPVKHYMYSFTAERLTESYTAYMTKYDTQGQELEYRWVETAVYQGVNGSTDADVKAEIAGLSPISISADGSFCLNQKGASVKYVSTREANGTIINRIDAAIDYNVKKTWENGTSPESITINLYRYTTSIDLSTAYVSFTFDEQGQLNTEQTHVPDGSGITVVQDDGWNAVVNNLPRYDESGHPYSYLLLEEDGFPEYRTTQNPDTGDYTTEVINGAGGKAIPILVQKVWLDDGDELHREPVTFTIYNRHTNEPVKKSDGSDYTVTLGGADSPGVWFQVVKVPADDSINDIDDVYVVETAVGDDTVEHHLDTSFGYDALYNRPADDQDEIFDVTTGNHRYQVTYQYKATAAGDASGVQGTFTVTNRRLGNIDLTVNKTWVNGSGDGQDTQKLIADELEKLAAEPDEPHLALAFRLKFADDTKEQEKNWTISYTGIDGIADYVQVGGADSEKVYICDDKEAQASSDQVILGINKNGNLLEDQTAHFFGLPKYDAEGKVVEYTVEEVWLDVSKGSIKVIEDKELKEKYPCSL
ncbi:MAG: Cna B-type domain-containing protein [Butyricicoccus sp.]|nr:Cna B-type domain-containing protein [Butyricicoccus sp.]